MSSILQRFSLSTLASSIKNNNSNQTYSKEEIESAIAEIKSLGKRAIEQQNASGNDAQANADTVSDIKKILKLMKQYSNNLYIQRVSCHALSNLAMQVVIARYIVNNNGFQYIRNALERFINDHKLCWLASSALWNMARPPANREIIGKNGVKLMLKVLSMHYIKHEKVTNTAIGALSNLSLCEPIKSLICKKDNIKLVLDVLNLYSKPNSRSVSVMTSGAGLLANLAVSDEHASTLLVNDALPVLIQLLQWRFVGENDSNDEEKENENGNENDNSVENTLHRNSCAALNNMVTAKFFIDKFLECNGIETVYSFIKHSKNELFINLLENCLTTMECDSNRPTTTMHLCALHNRVDLLKNMIEKASTIDNDSDSDSDSDKDSDMVSVGSHIWGKESKHFPVRELLNKTDGNNMTCLQYAALGKHYNVIEFLTKCGANTDILDEMINNNHDSESSDSDSNEEDIKTHNQNIKNAIDNGNNTMKEISNQHKQAITDTLAEMPTDLCQLIVTFENDIDMLQLANQFQ
jgi:hypothetical protein